MASWRERHDACASDVMSHFVEDVVLSSGREKDPLRKTRNLGVTYHDHYV